MGNKEAPFYYTESHKGKQSSVDYERLYSRDSWDARVWEIEKSILTQLLGGRHFAKYIDFACGTGRVTCFLEARADVSIGIDVADPMLTVASERVRSAKLLNIDIGERDSDLSALEGADLITAFRFFLNAAPELRREVLKRLAQLLSAEGVLVFNIHGNKASVRHLNVKVHNLAKRVQLLVTHRRPGYFSYRREMSAREVAELAEGACLRVEQIVSYAVMPPAMTKLLPRRLWLFLESRAVSAKSRWGTHLMFVCTRRPELMPSLTPKTLAS